MEHNGQQVLRICEEFLRQELTGGMSGVIVLRVALPRRGKPAIEALNVRYSKDEVYRVTVERLDG
jgi:hypothetical protein